MNEETKGCFNCRHGRVPMLYEPCVTCLSDGPIRPRWESGDYAPLLPAQKEIQRQLDADTKLTNPKDIVGTRKVPMSTVPANVLAELGVAMLEGASKYGRHNYRVAGVRASVYYDGVLRHLMAWWEGEDIDPDSGVSHVTKAIASLVVLRDAMHQSMWTDDRPPRSQPFYPELNTRAGEIVNRYADRNPRHYTIDDSKEAA